MDGRKERLKALRLKGFLAEGLMNYSRYVFKLDLSYFENFSNFVLVVFLLSQRRSLCSFNRANWDKEEM